MSESSSRKNSLTVVIGGLLLLGLIASGWFPRECPLLRQWLDGCPTTRISTSSDPDAAENARYPHLVIDKPLAEFRVQSQDFRETTEVIFEYRLDEEVLVATLALETERGLEPVSLITHPLLVGLSWSRYAEHLPNQALYQRTATYANLEGIQANLPPRTELAVDEVIAKRWGLKANQYQSLENLQSLDGINYLVTSYLPPEPLENWRQFHQTFDASGAQVRDGAIEWGILIPNISEGKEPFRITTVHVNYRTLR